MELIAAGKSAVARSFGAEVSMTMETGGLSLVVGRDRSPKTLIQTAGGRVVLTLSSTKVLAYLSLATHLAFQNHPHIAFAGPVELDQARFGQFIALLQQSRNAGIGSSSRTAAPKTDAVI